MAVVDLAGRAAATGTRAEIDTRAAEAADTRAEPDKPVEGRRRLVASMAVALRRRAAALHKRAAVPEGLRTPAEEEHKAAAVAALRTRVEHYIAAVRRPVRAHKLVERRRQAAVVRPVLLNKAPAEERWGLAPLLL